MKSFLAYHLYTFTKYSIDLVFKLIDGKHLTIIEYFIIPLSYLWLFSLSIIIAIFSKQK